MVHAGEAVDDREAVNLLVILGLDVAAGEIAKDPVADAKVVAILELVHGGRAIVDEGAVGALQVHGVMAIEARVNADVPARDRRVVNLQIAVGIAADDERGVGQHVARAHAHAGRINVNEASGAVAGSRALRNRDEGLGQLFHVFSRSLDADIRG